MRKQRLSNEALKKFRDLKLGVFFHFGLSTFVGEEKPFGEIPVDLYNPKELNVDQWIRVIKEAGAKYAVLTSKHVSGHCLWPTKYTDYSVKNSPVKTDVVKEFMAACKKYDISPGIYYCSWDNHNLFGSLTPGCKNGTWETAYVTEEYIRFQENQMDELFENYEGIKEFWLDIPRFIPRGVRER